MIFNYFRIFFVVILLIPVSVFGAKKKDSLNQNDPLMQADDMVIAGEWKLYMDKCGKSKHKQFLKDLAKLSWPDYKKYMAAAAKYTSGGFYTGACADKDTQALYDYYDWIISELTYLTGSDLDDNITESEPDIDSELGSLDDVEAKLLKLKELYDSDLISLEEYEDKKSEILDNF